MEGNNITGLEPRHRKPVITEVVKSPRQRASTLLNFDQKELMEDGLELDTISPLTGHSTNEVVDKTKKETTPLLNLINKLGDIEPFTLASPAGETGSEVSLKGHFRQNDKKRWLVLFLFSTLTFASALAWITFAPRADSFATYYHLDSTYYISSLSTIYMITYPPFLLPGLYLAQLFSNLELRSYLKVQPSDQNSTKGRGFGYGLKTTILFAATLHVLGCWIRYAAKDNFVLVFLGQAVASLCQVFTLGMPPKVAGVWFGKKEQNMAVSIGVTANVLGSAVGFLLTPFAVDPNHMDTTVPTYLLAQSIACSALLLVILFLMPKTPNVNPSGELLEEPSAFAVLKSVRDLLKELNFCIFTLSYGLMVGGQYAVSTLLTVIIMPVFPGRDEVEIGWLGFWMLVAGILTSLLSGYYLDRTGYYFSVSFALYLITVLAVLGMDVALELTSYWPLYICSLAYGMTSAALMPVIFQYGAVHFEAHDETTITGLLNCMAQIFGMILITSMSGLEQPNPTNTSKFTMRVPAWLLFAISAAGIIAFVSSFRKRKQ